MKTSHILLIILLLMTLCIRLIHPHNPTLTEEERAEFQDDQGNYYLFQADPYSFYDLAKRGDTSNLLSFIEWILMKLPGDELFYISLIPVAFSLFLAVAFFYLTLYYTGNAWSSFLGASLLMLSPKFIVTAYRGYADTPALNHFFIVVILLSGMYAIEKKSNNAAMTCALLSILYWLTWKGWVGSLIILSLALMTWTASKRNRIVMILTGISSSIFLWLNQGGLLHYLNLHNSFMITKEMQTPTYPWTTYAYISMLLIYIGINCRKGFRYHVLFVWLASTFFMANFAIRHFFYMLPPMFLAIALLTDYARIRLYDRLGKRFTWLYRVIVSSQVLKSFSILLVAVLTAPVMVPLMDDSAAEAMQWIQDNTPRDAKLLSYWDYGMIYQATSGRQAMFRSSERGTETIAQALLQEDAAMLQAMLDNRTYLIVNSDDLRKEPALELATGLQLTNDSTLTRALDNRLHELELLHCSEGIFKKVCIYKGG